MNDVLAKYREGLEKRIGQKIPRFAPEAVHTAPILALASSVDEMVRPGAIDPVVNRK